jgi:hypothetical protein
MRRRTVVGVFSLALSGCGASGTPAGPGTSSGHVLVFAGEPRVVPEGRSLWVQGRVKNTSPTRAYTGNIGVTFFDTEGKIVAYAIGTVHRVLPGEEVTYRAFTQETPTSWARLEEKITTELAER